MGVKAATAWLNEHGHRTRSGARWGIGPIHRPVSNTVYKGKAVFNRKDSKTGHRKPASELVTVPVDPIIDAATFDVLQAHRRSRSPKVVPPRVVAGPILLTGVAVCATCGGGMTRRKASRAAIATTPAQPQPRRASRPVPAGQSRWTSWTVLSWPGSATGC